MKKGFMLLLLTLSVTCLAACSKTEKTGYDYSGTISKDGNGVTSCSVTKERDYNVKPEDCLEEESAFEDNTFYLTYDENSGKLSMYKADRVDKVIETNDEWTKNIPYRFKDKDWKSLYRLVCENYYNPDYHINKLGNPNSNTLDSLGH